MIVLSKYNSSEERINVMFFQVQSIESSWILHDLDLVMINCSLEKSRVHLAKHSSLDPGMVDIKNSTIGELKIMSGHNAIIHSSLIHMSESNNSKLILTEILFPPESSLTVNNCSVKINASISSAEINSEKSTLLLTEIHFLPKSILKARSSHLQINISTSSALIYLIQSSLQASMFQTYVSNSSIWATKSKATFQNSVIPNVVLKENSILESNSSTTSSEIEAEDSQLLFTRTVFLQESFLRVNNCFVGIRLSIISGEIKLTQSSFDAYNSSIIISWIWAEESNITLQYSALLNGQIIDTNSEFSSFLTIKNCIFHINDVFLPNSKCVLCTKGVKDIIIVESVFLSDLINGYKTLFNISNGQNISVLDSKFETKEITHFYITNGKYKFSTHGSIFRKGNMTLLSNQSNLIESAIDMGIIEVFSASIHHNESVESTETKQIEMGAILIPILVPFFSVNGTITLCTVLFRICNRKKTKRLKRMRKYIYDAFVCYHDSDDDFALKIFRKMRKKFQLIPFRPEHDIGNSIIENSDNAIIIISKKFLESKICTEELYKCLMKNFTDPRFKLFVICTEEQQLLKTRLKDYCSGRAYKRFFSMKNRYLDIKDPELYDKLFNNMKGNNSKKHKNRRSQDSKGKDKIPSQRFAVKFDNNTDYWNSSENRTPKKNRLISSFSAYFR